MTGRHGVEQIGQPAMEEGTGKMFYCNCYQSLLPKVSNLPERRRNEFSADLLDRVDCQHRGHQAAGRSFVEAVEGFEQTLSHEAHVIRDIFLLLLTLSNRFVFTHSGV